MLLGFLIMAHAGLIVAHAGGHIQIESTATVAQLGKAFSEGEQRVRAGRSVQVASGDFFLLRSRA